MQTINQLILDENNMAFHPSMGNSYQLNYLGAEIFTLLREHKNRDEILEILSARYDISKEELFIDMGDFFSKLQAYGLLA